MVPFKNVTVTVTPVVQGQLSNQTYDNPELGTGVTGIQAYLEEQDAGEVFRDYNVRLDNPAIIQFNVADALTFNPGQGGEVADSEIQVTAAKGLRSYIGRIYRIQGRGDWHDDGLAADHVSYLVDRKTVPLGTS